MDQSQKNSVGTAIDQNDFLPSPLSHEGWLEFNRLEWGVQPHRVSLSPADGKQTWSLETVFYTNRRGKLVMPPLNPFLPLRFTVPAARPGTAGRRWREAATELVALWRARGLAGTVCLPPGYQDVRPWLWHGFVAQPRYTYVIPLPLHEDVLEPDVRNKIRKARRLGYVCDRIDDFTSAMECLQAPEVRKGFSYSISAESLRRMKSCLGENAVSGGHSSMSYTL